MDIEALKKDFLKWKYKNIPRKMLRWIRTDILSEVLTEEMNNHFSRMEDDQLAKEFKELCDVEGAKAEDYKYKILEMDEKRKVMASIRFYGLDVTKPFVEIVQTNYTIFNFAQAKEIADKVKEVYADFKPESIRFYSASDRFLTYDQEGKLEADFRFYGTIARNILRRPKPKNYDRVELQVVKEIDEFYERYSKAVERIYETHPEYQKMFFPSTEDDLKRYLKDGNIVKVLIDGEWAGIMSVDFRYDNFVVGYCIVEVFFFEEFRRSGCAVAAEYKWVEHKEFLPHLFLYETIHAHNPASIKTVKRLGMEDLGGYYFLPISYEEA